MAAIVALLAMFGGGNADSAIELHSEVLEHEAMLFQWEGINRNSEIDATPTAEEVAIVPMVTAAAASTPALSSPPVAGLENCPAVIVETFGEHAPAACAVAWCESRFDPHAVGDGGASLGMFQIQPRWHQWRVPGEDLMDPAVNTRAAWLISSGGTDWSAWTCKPW